MEQVRCRPARIEDLPFLAAMLGEAAVWRPDKATPSADEVLADPRYSMYLAGWPRTGDFGLIAEDDVPPARLGTAPTRPRPTATASSPTTFPELSIAVIAPRRHQGIGRRLLAELIEASLDQGYRALSLSVAENNPARALYESLGFVLIGQHGHSCTMIREATRNG